MRPGIANPQLVRLEEFAGMRDIRQGLPPHSIPSAPGCGFAASCNAANAVSRGDLGIFELAPRQAASALADVCGTEPDSALIASITHRVVEFAIPS